MTEASNSVHTCLLTDPKELPAGKAANIASLNSNILATLREPSTYAWNTSEKFQSPRGKCQYITTEFTALVDSEAEKNALDTLTGSFTTASQREFEQRNLAEMNPNFICACFLPHLGKLI